MFNLKTKLKINFFVFLLSFCIGILVVYLTAPEPKVIVKYPSISDSHKTFYHDDSGCYNYIPREVKCKE